MPRIAFTDIGLRSLPAPSKGQADYWDAKFPAFGCRVSSGGTKTFVLNIHKTRRTIGRYGLITLGQAREEAKRLLAERTLGRIRPQSITYSEALKAFLAEKEKSRRASTVANLKGRLQHHFAFKGRLADITHQDVVRKLQRIKTTHEHDHALSVAKTFFTWAQNRRYITENPTTGISPHGQASRSRVLSDAELRSVWIAAEEMGGSFGTIVKLLIATGQRRGEIAALQSSWIQTDRITLPSEVTKNGRLHVFPMGALAFKLVAAHCRKSNRKNGHAPLFPARGSSLEQISAFSGWSKSKAALDEHSGVTDWTLHDLRRTFATRLAELGTPIHVVEKLLSHISGVTGGLVRIYQRTQYWDEQVAAVARYEAYLTTILE
jgi:integrase